MKKLFFLLIIIIPSFAFAQIEKMTKIYFKVKANCACSFQLARHDKPAGQVFKMLSDSLLIAVEKETTGFYITCGESNTAYLKIEYKPGQSFYHIVAKMSCDKKNIDPLIIEPD